MSQFPVDVLPLGDEIEQTLTALGSGDAATGIRRAWLICQARFESDPAALRFAELLVDEEGLDEGMADLIAMQAFGHLGMLERNWMGQPASVIANLVEAAHPKRTRIDEPWLSECLRCALGMNPTEITAVLPEVRAVLEERAQLRKASKKKG